MSRAAPEPDDLDPRPERETPWDDQPVGTDFRAAGDELAEGTEELGLHRGDRQTLEGWREGTTGDDGQPAGFIRGLDLPEPVFRPNVGEALAEALGLQPRPMEHGEEDRREAQQRYEAQAWKEERRELSLAERLMAELEEERLGLEREGHEDQQGREAAFERDRQRLLGDILESAEARRQRQLDEIDRARAERDDDHDERRRRARQDDERRRHEDQEERERERQHEEDEREREAWEREEREREEREREEQLRLDQERLDQERERLDDDLYSRR